VSHDELMVTSRRGRLSRSKGKAYEREVAAGYRALYGDAVKRGWQARRGSDAPDVVGAPWWVEAKHQQRVSVRAALQQATEAQNAHGARVGPVVAHCRDNHQPALVALWEADWWALLARLKACGEGVLVHASREGRPTPTSEGVAP